MSRRPSMRRSSASRCEKIHLMSLWNLLGKNTDIHKKSKSLRFIIFNHFMEDMFEGREISQNEVWIVSLNILLNEDEYSLCNNRMVFNKHESVPVPVKDNLSLFGIFWFSQILNAASNVCHCWRLAAVASLKQLALRACSFVPHHPRCAAVGRVNQSDLKLLLGCNTLQNFHFRLWA